MDLLLYFGLIFRVAGFVPFIFTVFPQLFQETQIKDTRQEIRQLILFVLTMYVVTDTLFTIFTLYRLFNHISDLYADMYTLVGGISFLISSITFYLIYKNHKDINTF